MLDHLADVSQRILPQRNIGYRMETATKIAPEMTILVTYTLYTVFRFPVCPIHAFLDGVYRYDKVPILHSSQRKGRRGGVNFSQGHRIVHLATSTTGTKRLQHTVLLFLSLLEFTYCNKDQNVRG